MFEINIGSSKFKAKIAIQLKMRETNGFNLVTYIDDWPIEMIDRELQRLA